MLAITPNTEPIEPVGRSLDDVAGLVMAARRSAQDLGQEFLTYLLDMALIEIARRGSVPPG